MGYFVVSFSEDGDVSLGQMDKTELLKRLTPDHYGDTYYGPNPTIANGLPANPDSFVGLVIIKGEIVVPVERKVVKEIDIA